MELSKDEVKVPETDEKEKLTEAPPELAAQLVTVLDTQLSLLPSADVARLAAEAAKRREEELEAQRQREAQDFELARATLARLKQHLNQIERLPNLLNSDAYVVDVVRKFVATVESELVSRQENPRALRRKIQEWTEGEGYDAWQKFGNLRKPIVEQEKRDQAKADRERREKAAGACRQRASSAAIALAHQAGGLAPDGTGTVCCGIAHVDGGEWRARSGQGTALHPVMESLLSGVNQVEEWPVRGCGEVFAMSAYLTERKIDRVEDIRGEDLFSHAETYNRTTGKWLSRAACKNCDQWMERLHINRA
jgi:hypothetical protein